MLFIFFSNLLSVFKNISWTFSQMSMEAKFNHFNGCLVFNGMDVP